MSTSLGTVFLFASFFRTVLAGRSISESKLSSYFSVLPSSETHHVCVTGNRAHKMMESLVMHEGHSLVELEMTTKLDVDQKCFAKEYALGNTLFLVADELNDACAARWKVYSSTCNVLLHTQDGKACDQLYKFRLVSNQCHAPLVVVHSDEDMMNCYNSKVSTAREKNMMPLEEECTTVKHSVLLQENATGTEQRESEAIASVLRGAFQQTAGFAMKRFAKAKVMQSSGDSGGRGGHSTKIVSKSILASEIARLHAIVDAERVGTQTQEIALRVANAAKEFPVESKDPLTFWQAVQAKAQRNQLERSLEEGRRSRARRHDSAKMSAFTDLEVEIGQTEGGPSPLDGKMTAGGGSAVVIDNGSGWVKFGKSGGSEPDYKALSMVGYPKYPYIFVSKPEGGTDYLAEDQPGFVVAGEATKGNESTDHEKRLRGLLSLTYPIKHGIITNFEQMDLIWKNGCTNIGGCSGNVLITEPPLNPLKNKQQMVEHLKTADGVGASSVFVAMDALLALFAGGHHTGVVLDVGSGVTHVAPVVEGYVLSHAVKRMDLGGADLTWHMQRMLSEAAENVRGRWLQTTAEFEIAEAIKIKHSFLMDKAATFVEKVTGDASAYDEVYKLPDEQPITINTCKFRVAEPLFQPLLLGVDSPGVHELLIDSIMESDIDVRLKLWQNIVLSGGTTMTGTGVTMGDGGVDFQTRLMNEFKESPKLQEEFRNGVLQDGWVKAEANRDILVWLGGAIVGSLGEFSELFYGDASEAAEKGGPMSSPFDGVMSAKYVSMAGEGNSGDGD